eukprot:TRINITY_DN14216_c0_g1_i1.p1 TRINITY_DN14216_c0_g1~~TRINITY_DN14216_c0_g1_i1.p1  ORF type:complete len:562 (+),score=145.78 TRINITY_DN14216_c0_g1_i1:85-1770(+)
MAPPLNAESSENLSPMSRIKDDVAYRVKNTFVEIGTIPPEEFSYVRGRRCWSEATDPLKVPSPLLGVSRPLEAASDCSVKGSSKEASGFVPDTPSPFLHPSNADCAAVPPFELMGFGCEEDMGLPPAFAGDDGLLLSDAGMGYEGQDMSGYFGVPTMMFDPLSGACGWQMCMPLEAALAQAQMSGEPCEMAQVCTDMAAMDGQILMENHEGAQIGDECVWSAESGAMEAEAAVMTQEGLGSWAVPEKQQQEEGQQEWTEEANATEHKEPRGNQQSWDDHQSWEEGRGSGRQGNRKSWKDNENGQSWDDSRRKDESWNTWENGWRGKGSRSWRRERPWQANDQQWGKTQTWQESWEEQEQPQQPAQDKEQAPASPDEQDTAIQGSTTASSGSDSPAQPPEVQSGYTTVMLRNIPNKYTREMLVKQLNQDFKGRFDFVYLPIDFKNKCNVGYGFLNFRTPAACEEFTAKFDGVDVRKCLPGLNSKKIAGVTPARVQGLEDNVRRLRTGPVMNELVNHPDWMPLLLDEDGQVKPFPMPDNPAPAPATKPKRRGRDDHGRGGSNW